MKKKIGRPRKDANPEGSNISELSRLTGVDRSDLRRICADVKPVRIEGNQKFYKLSDIQALMARKPNKSLRDEKMFEDIRKVRLYNDKAEGKLIPRVEIVSAIQRILGPVSSIVESKLVNEWPTLVSGMPPEKCREKGRELADAVMAKFQELAKEFPA